MKLKLVKASKQYQSQIVEMLEEWKKDIEENHTNHSPWAIFRIDYHDFDDYLENLEVKEGNENGWVPDSVYFCMDSEINQMIGAVDIRHYLNEGLLQTGGHIGDGIRPNQRRKGYGKEMLKLALEQCKIMGIDKVLITCDADNVGSEKCIVANGGILENIVLEDGKPLKRYWIQL